MDRRVDLDHHELFIDGKHVCARSGEFPSTSIPPPNSHRRGGPRRQGRPSTLPSPRPERRSRFGADAGGRARPHLAGGRQRFSNSINKNSSSWKLGRGQALAAVRRQDMAAVIDTVRYYAGWATRSRGR